MSSSDLLILLPSLYYAFLGSSCSWQLLKPLFSLSSVLLEPSWGGHVHTHQLKSLGLLRQGLSHCQIWFLYHGAQSRCLEHLISVGFPQTWHWWVQPLHLILKLSVWKIFREEISKDYFQLAIDHLHVAESELDWDISVINTDQVFHGLENHVQSVSNHIHSHLAGSCNGYWIGIDATESFLEGRVLTGRRSDLLFVGIPTQVLANHWVHHKTWSE